MPNLQLYSASLSMFGMKVEIALREKAIVFDLIQVPFDNAVGYEPKHPDVVRINPKRQVPVLIHDGLELYDSTQIFEYLEDAFPEPPLWPAGTIDRAQARQIEHASDEVFFPHIVRLMGLQDDLHGEAAGAARQAAEAFYQGMEARLVDRAYLAGDYGFADIAFFMAHIFGERLGAPLTAATPRLKTWQQTILNRPAVRPVMQRLTAYLVTEGRFVPECLRF
jgi:glutathione S-transferase